MSRPLSEAPKSSANSCTERSKKIVSVAFFTPGAAWFHSSGLS
jgi:hypothetical protein